MEFPLLVLLCRCASQRFAVSAAQVTRVLGATQFVAVAGLDGCAVGIVNVAGVNLALCDARLALDLPSAALAPEQRFIELESLTAQSEPRRWLLWVEEASEIITVEETQCDALQVRRASVVQHVLRLALETVPLLDLASIEPNTVRAR